MKSIITFLILSLTTITFSQKTIDLTFKVRSSEAVMPNITVGFYSMKADTLLYQAASDENGIIQWKNAPKTNIKAIYYDSTHVYIPFTDYFYSKVLSTDMEILFIEKLSRSNYNALMSAMEKSTSDSILEVVGDKGTIAEFPGGRESLVQFLTQNIRVPVSAEEEGLKGKVYLRFVVEVDGTIKNLEVKKSLTPDTDFESMRVISIMPKWVPATYNGIAVPIYYHLPFMFNVQ